MTDRLRLLLGCTLVLLAAAPGSAPGQSEARDEAARVEFFEKKVRPVLVNNCYNCHSASTKAAGGLRVDDRNGLLSGGDSGPAVIPGQPEKSLLLKAIRQEGAVKMPPKKHLTDEEIEAVSKWIADGAAWPKVIVPVAVGKPNPKYEKLRREHWAWQPLRETSVPAVRDTSWPRSDIDRHILARLEEKGLRPVGDADKQTLLRRLTFDLTGLPPTVEEIDAFLKDDTADAYEKVVDRLLASPAYGERWGRHWLDVARYAESTGSSRNVPYPHAWRYRDYVIDSFAADKPFDQFVREQIAGDLLEATSEAQRAEFLVATGFLALGVKDVNQRFKVRFTMDNIDEQIDTVTRSVLGLTASCARCHDHKFDPIPQTDYYALAGIFHSTELCAGVRNKMGGSGLDYYDSALLLPLGPPAEPDPKQAEKVEQAQKALAEARAEFQALQGKAGDELAPDGRPKRAVARQKMNKLQQELYTLIDPASRGPVALGVREGKAIGDVELRVRGEAEKLGPVVPRGFLSVLDVPGAARVNPKQSGRLELAGWLTSPKNPLTARVMANRVWQHLFGAGLVRSVDNFGVTGDVPSHPELLDALAARFVRDGWSVKKLVRGIVLSRAYRLGSEATPAHLAADPGDRLVWRHAPRRLEAEEIRDAMLAASGKLDLSRPKGSAAQGLKVIEMPNNGPEAKRLQEAALANPHRSVYLPLLRGLTPRSLEVFDFAEQGMVTGSRDTTTVAPQALYLLNDPFVLAQAAALSERLAKAGAGDADRIDRAYRLTLGRPAAAKEAERVQRFLADYEATARAALAPTPGEKEAAPAADPKAAAWAAFCQALLGSAEFRYVR